MTNDLDPTTGEHLDNEAFYEDFNNHFWNTDHFWKLERIQHFAEPTNPSWEAFNQGNWEEALRLHEARIPGLLDYHDQCREYGITTRRIRIVEHPLDPYLQWEMHLLFLRDATGGPITVLPQHAVAHLENETTTKPNQPLPEICGMNDTVMYNTTYDANGVLNGAIKYTDPTIIAPWRRLTFRLFEQGEPMGRYFLRTVKPLPPPPAPTPLPTDYLEQHGRMAPPRQT